MQLEDMRLRQEAQMKSELAFDDVSSSSDTPNRVARHHGAQEQLFVAVAAGRCSQSHKRSG